MRRRDPTTRSRGSSSAGRRNVVGSDEEDATAGPVPAEVLVALAAAEFFGTWVSSSSKRSDPEVVRPLGDGVCGFSRGGEDEDEYDEDDPNGVAPEAALRSASSSALGTAYTPGGRTAVGTDVAASCGFRSQGQP